MSSQWGSQKLLQGLVSHELTAYLSIFKQFKINELWPYCQKHVNQIILNCNSLKLSLTNIWGLCSKFSVWEKLGWLNWSVNFSIRGYLPLIWKDSGTCIHDLEVYVIKDFLLHETISRKLCRFLFIFSTGFTSLSVLLLSPLSITFFVFVHSFWFYFI